MVKLITINAQKSPKEVDYKIKKNRTSIEKSIEVRPGKFYGA